MTALMLVLDPILEVDLPPEQYAYRPGRNAQRAVASGTRNVGSNGAIAVGGYIALAGLWAAPISGASMNPVRSLASDLVRGEFGSTWIYLVGPLVGAMIAVGFEWILKGPTTTTGAVVAQGTLQEDEAAPDRG